MNSEVIREISPEEPVVCGGKDLWKRNVLRRDEWKSAGVIDGESGEDETGELTWSKTMVNQETDEDCKRDGERSSHADRQADWH